MKGRSTYRLDCSHDRARTVVLCCAAIGQFPHCAQPCLLPCFTALRGRWPSRRSSSVASATMGAMQRQAGGSDYARHTCLWQAHTFLPSSRRLPQGRPLWNRYINSRIRRVEFNASLPNLAANWNVCTGLWLRHCEWWGQSWYIGIPRVGAGREGMRSLATCTSRSAWAASLKPQPPPSSLLQTCTSG